MRRHFIIIALVILVAACGVGAYLWFLTSPYHPLRQLGIALEDHDWERFSACVDVDLLTRNLTSDMAAQASQALAGSDVSPSLSRGLGALVAMKIRPALRRDLKSWVSGEKTDAGLLKALTANDTPQQKPSLEGLVRQGDTAVATIDLGQEMHLELELTRQEHAWRITRVCNVPELIKQSSTKR